MAITVSEVGQNNTFPTTSPWTGTATLSTSIGTGETVAVAIQYGSQAYPPVAISDSAGNTYVKAPGAINAAAAYDLGATSGRRIAWYICASSIGTVTTVTVYNGGVSNVAAFRVFRVLGAGGVRDANANWNTGNLEALASAQTNDLVLSAIAWSTGNASSTLTGTVNGETWTDDGQMGTGAGNPSISVAHALATASGSRSARFGTSVGGSFGVATVVLYPAVPPSFIWTVTVNQG